MRIIAFAVVIFFASPLATAEIYRWVDAQGNVHFDSRSRPGAEPVEVKPQIIERDEATRERQARTERFYDARRQEQQAAQQAAGEQDAKRERACSEWKQQLSQLSHGGRYFRTDAKGERVYYSDEEIGATRLQLTGLISRNCS